MLNIYTYIHGFFSIALAGNKKECQWLLAITRSSLTPEEVHELNSKQTAWLMTGGEWNKTTRQHVAKTKSYPEPVYPKVSGYGFFLLLKYRPGGRGEHVRFGWPYDHGHAQNFRKWRLVPLAKQLLERASPLIAASNGVVFLSRTAIIVFLYCEVSGTLIWPKDHAKSVS